MKPLGAFLVLLLMGYSMALGTEPETWGLYNPNQIPKEMAKIYHDELLVHPLKEIATNDGEQVYRTFECWVGVKAENFSDYKELYLPQVNTIVIKKDGSGILQKVLYDNNGKRLKESKVTTTPSQWRVIDRFLREANFWKCPSEKIRSRGTVYFVEGYKNGKTHMVVCNRSGEPALETIITFVRRHSAQGVVEFLQEGTDIDHMVIK